MSSKVQSLVFMAILVNHQRVDTLNLLVHRRGRVDEVSQCGRQHKVDAVYDDELDNEVAYDSSNNNEEWEDD